MKHQLSFIFLFLFLFQTILSQPKLHKEKERENAAIVLVQPKNPRLLSYGVMMNDPIYIPEKDMTLFASYVKINKAKENRFEVKDYVQDGTFIYAHHHKKNGQKFGKELEPYSYIPVLRDEKRIFDEHNIVQIAEGSRHFMALIRYKGGVYFSARMGLYM